MTTAPPPGRGPAADAAEDLRVALVHLRLGQLALARAELEDLAGLDELGVSGLAALAEARWRTGDGGGAAAAAEEHLEAGGSAPIAICIAAEAAAAEGRPDDAKALVERLPDVSADDLDALFAGMPRRASWAAGPIDHTEIEEIRREVERRGAGAGVRTGAADRRIRGPREQEAQRTPARSVDAQASEAEVQAAAAADVELARRELDSRPGRALLRLTLALRRDPSLAADILDAIAMRDDAAAAMLRGDAHRLLGNLDDAEAAFDAASRTLEES